MANRITAKFKVQSHNHVGANQTQINMQPDYNDPRNKEWAPYTPSGSISLTVIDDVVPHFPLGANFLVTFDEE